MTASAGDEQPPDISRLAAGEPSTLRFRDNQNGEVRSTEEDDGGPSQSRSNLAKVASRVSASQTASGDVDEILWRVVSARDGRATIGATYATISSSSMADLCHRDWRHCDTQTAWLLSEMPPSRCGSDDTAMWLASCGIFTVYTYTQQSTIYNAASIFN